MAQIMRNPSGDRRGPPKNGRGLGTTPDVSFWPAAEVAHASDVRSRPQREEDAVAHDDSNQPEWHEIDVPVPGVCGGRGEAPQK